MVDPVVGRRVEYVLKPAHCLYKFCVDPELVNEVKAVHYREHPWRKSEQHNRRIEYPVQSAAKPALPHGYAQVVMLARMMDDVKVPEKPRFVTCPVKDVID